MTTEHHQPTVGHPPSPHPRGRSQLAPNGGQRTEPNTPHNLSAEHGVVGADTPLLPYDRSMCPARVEVLRARVAGRLRAEVLADGMPREVLVIAEALYLHLIVDLFWIPDRCPRLIWVSDHTRWPQAAAVLDRWGWP